MDATVSSASWDSDSTASVEASGLCVRPAWFLSSSSVRFASSPVRTHSVNARCIIVAMVCNKFVVCELGRGGCRLTLHDSATRHRLRVTELWFFVRSHTGLCELYATAPALLERREPRDLDLEPPCSPIPLAGIEPPSVPLSEDGWQQALASKLVLRWAGRAPDKGRGQREASKSSNDERAKDPGRGRQYSWQEGLAQRVVLNLAAGLAPTASPEVGGEEHIVEPWAGSPTSVNRCQTLSAPRRCMRMLTACTICRYCAECD